MATNGKKILTIDDEEAIVDLIVDILETHDYEAIRANKWTEAIDALNHENPDLVLLDLKMPTIDGASILDFIRTEGFDVPVIIVSGFVTDTVAKKMSKQGVSGFVHKPFKARQLLSTIEQALDQHEQALDQQPQTVHPPPQPSKFQTPLDALYGQPLQSIPEAEDEEPASASVDMLYQGEDQKKKPIDIPEPSQAPATEILQAFQKLEKPSKTEQPPAPPTPTKKPPGELLEALNRLDKEASVEDPPQPASSPEPDAISTPSPEIKPPEPAQPSPALDNPLTTQPSPLDPAAARSRETPVPPISRPEPKPHPRRLPPRRSAIGRKNWMYMGVITFVCMLVAGFLAAMQYVASEFDPKAFQAQAQKAISKQATQEILKELQKGQGK